VKQKIILNLTKNEIYGIIYTCSRTRQEQLTKGVAMATIQGVGHLTDDPRYIKGVGTKKSVAYCNVAFNSSRKNSQGEYEAGQPEYVSVTAFAEIADAASTLKKGNRVLVNGELHLTLNDEFVNRNILPINGLPSIVLVPKAE